MSAKAISTTTLDKDSNKITSTNITRNDSPMEVSPTSTPAKESKQHLQAQLNPFVANGQYLWHQYTVLKQHYSNLLPQVKQNPLLSSLFRDLCSSELDSASSRAQFPAMIEWLQHAPQRIDDDLRNDDLAGAEYRLLLAAPKLAETEWAIQTLREAISAHDLVWKEYVRLRQRISGLSKAIGGLEEAIALLRMRYKALDSPVLESPRVSIWIRSICDVEFGENPIEETPFQILMRRLHQIQNQASRALKGADLEGVYHTLKAAESYMRKTEACLLELQEAVDAYATAQQQLRQAEIRVEVGGPSQEDDGYRQPRYYDRLNRGKVTIVGLEHQVYDGLPKLPSSRNDTRDIGPRTPVEDSKKLHRPQTMSPSFLAAVEQWLSEVSV